MVEPLFRAFLDAGVKPGDTVAIDAEEAKHAISVRRMRVGEAIQLADGRGLRARGVVENIQPGSLAVLVEQVIQELEPSLKLTLVQALAKGDRDEMAIQAASELGIWNVIPWQAERSISRWDGPKVAKGVARWQAIVGEASKQSLQAFEPKVSDPLDSRALANGFSQFDRVLVLDPTSDVGIAQVSFSSEARVALVVGPEGGISNSELDLFESSGAIRVRLGSSILRTSTAGVVAISAIQTKFGFFGADRVESDITKLDSLEK